MGLASEPACLFFKPYIYIYIYIYIYPCVNNVAYSSHLHDNVASYVFISYFGLMRFYFLLLLFFGKQNYYFCKNNFKNINAILAIKKVTENSEIHKNR